MSEADYTTVRLRNPSLQSLTAMLSQWPGVVVLLDATGRVRWCSEGAQSLATAVRDDLAGLTLDELGLPWTLSAPQLQAVLAGAALELELPGAEAGDSHQWRLRARRIDLGEHESAALCIGELVARRTNAKLEGEPEQAFDAAQAGLWRWDLESDVASVDEAWCRQHQLDPCTGGNHLARWSSQLHPDDSAQYRRRLSELRSGANEYFEAEYRILTAANEWLWILQRGRVIERSADGSPTRVIGICIDIDERKREETASKANESRLATALWGARAAFWQWHLPTNTRTLSPMWFAMTRYSREQWDSVPNPWFSRVHGEDVVTVEAAIRRYQAGGTDSLEYEYRLMTAGGEWKWLLDRARAVEWDLEGNPTVIMGVSLDVDAQKRVNVELRATEARLQTAVWGARMGLWETDVAHDTTRWFDQWCDQYGIDPCDGPDHMRRWYANVHPEDLPAAQQRYQAHLAGGEDSYDSEYRVRTREGGWRWLFCRARVTERDEQGRPLRLVGVCMDVDARHQEQMQQHFTQPWLESAMSVARAGMWQWRIEPREITYTDTYYRLFGVEPPRGRSEPRFWFHHIHPEDYPRVQTLALAVVEGREQRYEAEYRMRCADGHYIWVLDRATVTGRSADGRAECLVGCVFDVSERRAEKDALRQSEERFRSAAVAARGMIYEVNYPSGAGDQRFGLEAVLGYREDEVALTRDAWLAVMHPDDVQRFLAARPIDREQGHSDELEYRMRHKAGHWVTLRDHGILTPSQNGGPARRIGFIQAVSAQSELLHDARAQRA